MKKSVTTLVIIYILITCSLISSSAQARIIYEKSAPCIKVTQQEKKRILSLVKTGYMGDYTLGWAEAHDYNESEKMKWVNIKGYSSKTRYLIWVNTAYQRLNVFTGSAGNWKLDKTFIIGTGVPGRETPKGVWKILGRKPKGWTTSVYTVKPVVSFINKKYGFHSRLYYPNTTKIYNASIGFPCSHGCIRMYTNDVAWFYKYIPLGTTVVVY